MAKHFFIPLNRGIGLHRALRRLEVMKAVDSLMALVPTLKRSAFEFASIAKPWLRSAVRNVSSLLPAYRRSLTWVAVGAVHVVLLVLVLFGFTRPPAPPAAHDLQLTIIGGPRVLRSEPIQPTLATPPQVPLVVPPEIEVDDTPSTAITVAAAPGGPGVTVPAEAIGETHTAPTLSADLTDIARKSTLRLRLRVAEDGSIKDASVDASTGSAQLDRIALAWVRAHWRYRPALRDGTPIAVTTTALVRF